MANEFVTDQWSIKRTIRKIALSRTYQMSSRNQGKSAVSFEKDPANKLLHRANIKRLTGESIRDTILLVSGQLNEKQFGPPVKVHLTPFMQGRGRPGKSGPLAGEGRRSVYLEVRRNFLSPMMLAFDTPAPINTIGRRNKSNVPAQALILMNSPFVVEQAGQWAKQLKETDSSSDKITSLFQQAFGRTPEQSELVDLEQFIDQQTKEFGSESAWRDLCHVLINMKEFIYIK